VELLAKTCNYDVMDGERLAARLFVGVGIVLWATLAVGAALVYGASAGISTAVAQALVLVAVNVVALVIGWFYENIAAVVLFLFAAGSIAWGVMIGWEAGVWGLMAIILIAPAIVAGLLFIMAAQMQKACDLAAGR
jgi:hypothetical protein